MELYHFSNRTALVTGSTHGIGREIAHWLARGGANVLVTGRNEGAAVEVVKEIRKAHGNASYCIGDVSEVAGCERFVKESIKVFGSLDILVNCAGILTSTSIEKMTKAEWDKILSVNLDGTFFMIQQALPYLRKSGHGRIINISSNAGRMGGYENSQAYTASKGGIIAITMGIARKLAPDGITVNVVCPGTTVTEMTQQYDAEKMKRLVGRIPLGRLGSPKDTAAAVGFFASEEAGFITGAVLDVNGGMYMG